jgi:hypothetical protein
MRIASQISIWIWIGIGIASVSVNETSMETTILAKTFWKKIHRIVSRMVPLPPQR